MASSTSTPSSGAVVAETSTVPTVEVRGRPEERGVLDVRTKALQHIVERAALEAQHTVVHSSLLGRLRGADWPSASVTMHGRSARVEVDVACVWPAPVAQIAAEVRDTVLREATRISGVHIRSVDVTVHAITPDSSGAPTRRVE